jgi:hypothetical protein
VSLEESLARLAERYNRKLLAQVSFDLGLNNITRGKLTPSVDT